MDERRDRSVQVSARTVDEAVLKALQELGLTRDEVEVEIIKTGSRGLLGLLGEEAVVRVSAKPKSTALATEQPPAPVITKEAPPPRPAAEQQPEPRASATSADVATLGSRVLRDLLTKMGIRAEVTREPVPPGDNVAPDAVLLNISGKDLGVLIGRQGETLRDLQFLTALIVSRHTEHWPNLIVDVEHYKSRRRKSLEDLAKRVADRVRITGEPVSLEPMPPHERRFVHLALRDDPDVITESVGQDEKRKVVIMPKK